MAAESTPPPTTLANVESVSFSDGERSIDLDADPDGTLVVEWDARGAFRLTFSDDQDKVQ